MQDIPPEVRAITQQLYDRMTTVCTSAADVCVQARDLGISDVPAIRKLRLDLIAWQQTVDMVETVKLNLNSTGSTPS